MTPDKRGAVRSAGPPAAMVELQQHVEHYLGQIVLSRDAATARLVEAMRYSLLAGGQRIRPVLAMATADACGRPPASVHAIARAALTRASARRQLDAGTHR